MAVPRHNVNLTANELRLMAATLVGRDGSTGGRERFETDLTLYLGVAHVRTVSSGRVALHLALDGLGLRPGDRVVLPRYCFYSLVHVIQGLGMTPVFAPIDSQTLAIDPTRLEPLLHSASAVVVIHPFGQVAPIAALRDLCEAAEVPLVEDGSQATGGGIGGQKVGALGDAGVFSLVSGKNLQTFGGGVLSTNDDAVIARVDTALARAVAPTEARTRTRIRDGFSRWFLTTPLGYTGLMQPLTRGIQAVAPAKLEAMFHEERLPYDPEQPLFQLSDTQGALGCLELAELDRRNQVRRNNALRLIDGLRGTIGLVLPQFDPAADNTFNAVAVRVADAAALQLALRRRGIDTRSDYMSWYGPARDFDEDVLYLPNHPGMDGDDVDRVVRAVRDVI